MQDADDVPFWKSRGLRFAGLAILFAGGLFVFLTRGSAFDIAEVQVSTDGELSRDAILAAAAVPARVNFFHLEHGEIQKRVAALPQVRHASVRRYFPDSVSIVVQERTPRLWLSCPTRGIHPEGSGKRVAVDHAGVAFSLEDKDVKAGALPILHLGNLAAFEDGQPLPCQTGLAAAKLLELWQKKPILRAGNIQALRELNDFSVRSEFDSGLTAVFGVTEIERQLANLGLILEDAARNGKKVATVNLVTMKNIAVTFAELDPSPY